VSALPGPKGLLFAPKGLVKPALDIFFGVALRGLEDKGVCSMSFRTRRLVDHKLDVLLDAKEDGGRHTWC
jgi:hypothetical protein